MQPSVPAVGAEIILVSKCYCLYDSGSHFPPFTMERGGVTERDAGLTVQTSVTLQILHYRKIIMMIVPFRLLLEMSGANEIQHRGET